MFYCNTCGDTRGWPTGTLSRSRGRCEVCFDVADCNDVPSRFLPAPQKIKYCKHGNDTDTFCQQCDLDQSPRHVIEGTVPVFVYVRDGEVEKVVVDDSDPTFNLAVKKSNEQFEVLDEEKDPVWIQVAKSAAFDEAASKKPWPAWEWGW